MIKLAHKYPQYGFEKHVGYGTALHKATLAKFGPCPEHRQSFRPVQELAPSTHINNGQIAENSVIEYLTTQKHTIIAHNYKTKFYEIDIISINDQVLYFTEVKYSQDTSHEGTPLARITDKKSQQMRFAAEAFLAAHHQYSHLQPTLAAASVSGPNFQLERWFTVDDTTSIH